MELYFYSMEVLAAFFLSGGLFVFSSKFLSVATPQDKIIEQLEVVIERQRKQIFDLKEENLLLRMQLKAMGVATGK